MDTLKKILHKTTMSFRPAARTSSWYKSADLSYWEAAVFSLIAVSILIFLYFKPTGSSIESAVQHPVEFWFRAKVNKEPVMSKNIKIFALDDNITSKYNTTDFTLKNWALILEKLDKLSPKKIFIDKVFGLPSGIDEHKYFVDKISSMGTPIVAAVFLNPHDLKYRPEILLRKWPDYSIINNILSDAKDLRQVNWLAQTPGRFYGPHEKVRQGFRHLGHINYDGSGFVRPLIRPDNEYAVPHLSLFASDSIQLDKEGVFLDDHVVPLDRFARVPINLVNTQPKHMKLATFKHLIASSPDIIGKEYEITPDDYILIMPNYYTGSTDFADTPAGTVPGGFLVASLINSVITKNWIKPASYGVLWILLSAIAGILCVLFLQAKLFWFTEIFIISGLIWAGLLSFAYFNQQLPWLFSVMSFSTCSLLLFAKRSWVSEEKSIKLKDAFEGNIPSEHLDRVLNSPEKLAIEARSEILTIMSIDLVGFSHFYESSPPPQAFQVLQSIFQSIVSIVHKHGGIADKTHDRGFVFYFGYDLFGDSKEKKDHADAALDCAFEIMKSYLDGQMQAYNQDKTIPYPIRIGINTASVFIGDLGGHNKIDFSIIGYGVSDAKKLEKLCNDYMIIVSSNTKNFLTKSHNRLRVSRRISGKKQLKDNLEAYEYDAFIEEPTIKQNAINNFRKMANLERLAPRHYVPDSIRLEVRTGEGVARLVDFSHRGIGILGYFYAAKGEVISLELIFNGKKFFDTVEDVKVGQLKCRVMWSYPDKNLYRHGLEIIDLTDELANLLEQKLLKVANVANRLRKTS